jgi:hypothetical protein
MSRLAQVEKDISELRQFEAEMHQSALHAALADREPEEIPTEKGYPKLFLDA